MKLFRNLYKIKSPAVKHTLKGALDYGAEA